jgi:hypothetical protein
MVSTQKVWGYAAKRLRGRGERGGTRIREQKDRHEIDGRVGAIGKMRVSDCRENGRTEF